MDQLPDIKQLKKLANACRKAGIKTFKGFGFEFTLDNESPTTSTKSPTKTHNYQGDPVIDPQTPTEEELMYWSAGTGDQ